MSEFTALAVRPEAHVATLDRKSRKALERAHQAMMIQRGRAYLAQQAVSANHLAALESIASTLSTAGFIKAMHGATALPGYTEYENVDRQQYFATVSQLNAIADHKVISWLVED